MGQRRSREADAEAFNQLRDAAHIHFQFVPRAESGELLRVGRPAGQRGTKLSEIISNPARFGNNGLSVRVF
jgi:hypothetical protein